MIASPAQRSSTELGPGGGVEIDLICIRTERRFELRGRPDGLQRPPRAPSSSNGASRRKRVEREQRHRRGAGGGRIATRTVP